MVVAVETVQPKAADRRWPGFALAVAALTVWAGWFAVTRLSLTRELGAYDIAALRLGVGALVLLPAFGRSASRGGRGWKGLFCPPAGVRPSCCCCPGASG